MTRECKQCQKHFNSNDKATTSKLQSISTQIINTKDKWTVKREPTPYLNGCLYDFIRLNASTAGRGNPPQESSPLTVTGKAVARSDGQSILNMQLSTGGLILLITFYVIVEVCPTGMRACCVKTADTDVGIPHTAGIPGNRRHLAAWSLFLAASEN